MSDALSSMVQALGEAAVLLREGRVAAFSPMALHYLPQLRSGADAPPCLPRPGAPGGGLFTAGLSAYSYTCSLMEDGWLLIFRPAPQQDLTDAQLDGALRQLRQFMGEFLVELPQQPGPEGAPFRKSFYRMFRLLDNLDYLRLASGNESLPFQPVTMDLAGLCRQVVSCAAPLLAQADVTLSLLSSPATLLIPGDSALLQRLLLELIANAVRASGEEKLVSLSLSVLGGRALLSLSHSGAAPTPRQQAALLQQDADCQLPAPFAGAGLGLSVARHIAALHGGALLFSCGEESPVTILSLPAGPAPSLPLHTPRLQQDGGLSPLLVGLADVLPAQVFATEDLT